MSDNAECIMHNAECRMHNFGSPADLICIGFADLKLEVP